MQARNILGYLLSPITNIEFPCFENDGGAKLKSIGYSNVGDTDSNDKTISTNDTFSNSDINIVSEKTNLQKSGKTLSPVEQENKNNQEKTPEEVLLERVIDMESGSLTSLGLSNRIIKILKKSNINFTWDLMQYDSPDPPYLIDIKGLGPKSVKEIKEKLKLFYEPPY